jgi:hypothetical protein
MNAYSTELLARDHITELHREADDDRRGRTHTTNDRLISRISKLASRVSSLRRGDRPVASLSSRSAS